MSYEASAWAYEVEGTSLDVFIMVTLGQWADENGIAWPSQDTLAERCRATVRAVNRCLQRMEEKGYLQAVNVKVAMEIHKELMGDKKPSNNFKAWVKGADKRCVCYVLNLGRFGWRAPKQQDSRSISSDDAQSPISGEIQDSNDQTDRPRVLLQVNINHNTNQADGDAAAPSPVGSAGEGQPPGAEIQEAPAPKPPAANAAWKANAKAVFDAFMFGVFEKVIEPLTVISDEDGILTLGALNDRHVEQFDAATAIKPTFGLSARDALAQILEREIVVRVWSEVAAEARQRAASERRMKRLMGSRECRG